MDDETLDPPKPAHSPEVRGSRYSRVDPRSSHRELKLKGPTFRDLRKGTSRMETSRGTLELLSLENDPPDILFESAPVSGEPIWPHLRMPIANAMAATELQAEGVVVEGHHSPVRTALRYLRAFGPERRLPRTRVAQRLCFLVGGGTIAETQGRGENWLVDDFARTEPDSVVIQRKPLTLSPSFERTFSLQNAFARIDLTHKLRPLAPPPEHLIRGAVDAVAARVAIHIDPDTARSIVRSVSYDLARIGRINNLLKQVFDRLDPSMVLIEDASYGSYAGAIRQLRERGVAVIEPQHGWIGPSHAAYNFGVLMRSEHLERALPDTLLTFGDFWSAGVRFPGETVSIGKPHMDRMSTSVGNYRDRRRAVLVASSVSEPQKMAALVRSLRLALPRDWEIVFRTHPSERSTQERRYPQLVGLDGVVFDDQDDVYESMRNVRAVIGVASTVLYEALAMRCHVFAFDSPFARYYLDPVFGEPISDDEGLMRAVDTLTSDAPPPISDLDLDRFWKRDAVGNFARFVAERQPAIEIRS